MHRSLRSFGAVTLATLSLATLSISITTGCGGFNRDRTIGEARADGIAPLDESKRDARIVALRAKGKTGLQEALAEYDAAVAEPKTSVAELARVRDLVDRVAAQRDAWASRLYWYTDLDQAEKAAHESGKPILSLRLLGDLRDSLSCANSRLFRMALYSNDEVRRALDQGFVLHWSSERAVPRITVDYGDGRVVSRTITGNSIHYLLDERGRPIDAIPGLYGPAAFLRAIGRARELARSTAHLDDGGYREAVIAYHQAETTRLTAAWRVDLKSAGIDDALTKGAMLPRTRGAMFFGGPPALFVGEMTIGKAAIERPLVHALQPQLEIDGSPLGNSPWAIIGQHHASDGTMDQASRALVLAQRPLDWSTSDPTPLGGDALAARIATFESALAEESVRNEYALHGEIHAWFQGLDGMSEKDRGFSGLDQYVYTSVFLTPKSDPWLGLAQLDVLSGIADDGLAMKKQ